MPVMPASLLPPNATELERGLEAATARVGAVPFGRMPTLWNPATCPIALLPWLAWSLSVDQWDASWPESMKRDVVATAIDAHRRKGTRASVETVLGRFDALLQVVEWFEASPAAAPHTFDVHLPLVTAPGSAPGGDRATAAFAEAVIREVAKVKPLREHLTLVQVLRMDAAVGLFGVARVASWQRNVGPIVSDTSPDWNTYLQTEDGETMQDETGSYLVDGA